MTMQKVYIISGRRTAVGSFLGALSETSVGDMGAEVVKAVLSDAKVSPDQVDFVTLSAISSWTLLVVVSTG
ncbi:MAG: hypothetical protein GX781_06415, partial [Clostridiales bacterium]|nr:hypothetical protein [Clostridiales bacterium]